MQLNAQVYLRFIANNEVSMIFSYLSLPMHLSLFIAGASRSHVRVEGCSTCWREFHVRWAKIPGASLREPMEFNVCTNLNLK